MRVAPRFDIGTLTREVKEVHEAFPKWTLDNAFIHWFLKAFLVADTELAARAVTGVSHDKGVDGVYIDEDFGKAFVLQGKFHQGENAPQENRSDVLSFAQLARNLTDSEKAFRQYLHGIDPAVSAKLEQVRKRVRRRDFALHLYYVSTGKCSSPLKAEAESEVSQANGRCEVSVLDRREVLTLLADYLSGAAPPVPYLDLRIDARGVPGSDGVIQRMVQRDLVRLSEIGLIQKVGARKDAWYRPLGIVPDPDLEPNEGAAHESRGARAAVTGANRRGTS